LRPKIGDIPGEQIKLSCEFSVANAGVSSMFNVVSKCAYGNTIDTEAAKEAWTEKENKMNADGATADEIEYAKTNFYILDAQRYFVKNSFDFVVETLGVYTNNNIVKKACMVMQDKITNFKNNIDDKKMVSIEQSVVIMKNCWDVILINEDYTLGKALEFYLYEHFYNSKDTKKLSFCAFKKLHPHDSSSRLQIAYINNVSSNDISMDLKTACDELLEVYEAIFKMF
jgi:DNA-directed RNA polymerase subunit L